MALRDDALTVPLFTAADASRLVGVPAPTARRWLEGYSYQYRGERRTTAPRLGPHAKHVEGVLLMSFLDLLEVRLARRLRQRGVPWRNVDRTAVWFRDAWKAEHPFVLRRLRSDGRDVFAEIGRNLGDKALMRIGTDQYVFDAIVEPSLFDVLDFRPDGLPERLWPAGRDAKVVVDPARAFGEPILDAFGIPVRVLARAYVANDNDAARVASAFEIPVEAVEAALRFDAGLRVAA
ncbi:hypothetical protein [Elioraea tepidiphila]|jgi:uncharacterized protein (DUF433 family)|uniref:hypothetical protein n=1 Tax=Elioraea tepidiphila TaxID=457934 RepID=UPI002FD9A139